MSGTGNKTLEEITFENNKNLVDILENKTKWNQGQNKSQTLKEIASENDMAAKDVYELIMK